MCGAGVDGLTFVVREQPDDSCPLRVGAVACVTLTSSVMLAPSGFSPALPVLFVTPGASQIAGKHISANPPITFKAVASHLIATMAIV